MGQFHDTMDADMEIRGLAPNTRKAYLLAMRKFVQYFMRPPDTLTLEAGEFLRRFLLHVLPRYLVGYTIAVNSRGESIEVSLDDIYEDAKRLGEHMTACEH